MNDLLRDLTELPGAGTERTALAIDLTQPLKAQLTDDDVRQICELHNYHGIGYKRLAKKFEVSVSCIQGICTGRRRTRPGTQGYAPIRKPVL